MEEADDVVECRVTEIVRNYSAYCGTENWTDYVIDKYMGIKDTL